MARVDKTESAVGVIRGTLKQDIPENLWNKPIGVGIDSAGLTVVGAGQTGIIGVAIFDRTNYKVKSGGTRVDIFTLADILEVDLAAGSKVYALNTDGTISTTATGGTLVGFTVETDRLIVRL